MSLVLSDQRDEDVEKAIHWVQVTGWRLTTSDLADCLARYRHLTDHDRHTIVDLAADVRSTLTALAARLTCELRNDG